jgi:hypothetical protein
MGGKPAERSGPVPAVRTPSRRPPAVVDRSSDREACERSAGYPPVCDATLFRDEREGGLDVSTEQAGAAAGRFAVRPGTAGVSAPPFG